MQAARETSRQKRSVKRRNSRKKSLSPSDLKCHQDTKNDNKLTSKRSLSEGSVKMRHKKGNIQRTLTYPITCADFEDISSEGNNLKGGLGPPESDESNIPPTSSDRDTEDDLKVTKTVPYRPRWDSGSEMDSLVSIAVKKAARRRRTPASLEWGANCEPGDVSEAEAGRMRPEDYRLVFLSSDSSCREDTEDSASTSSSAAPPAPDDCDWDYFEPGAPTPPTLPAPTPPRPPPACPRACSCGAEPRIVAVPVPVPVPVPAALWPALLAFPSPPPAPHWNTYPGFPPLDAAALARLTTAAVAAASVLPDKLEMTIDGTDKARKSQAPDIDNDKSDKVIERSVEHETSEIKVIAEDSVSVLSVEVMPEHLDAENAFPSSNESAESSDSEAVARRSYDLRSGAPEEPATTDEDSDDSGGGGQFSRVFVVNPAESSSEMEDNADSSGIDCDDSFDKKSDSLEIIAAEIAMQNHVNVEPAPQEVLNTNDDNIVILETVNFSDNYPIISLCNSADSGESVSKNASIMTFCDENMLQSEICEKFNSFNTVTDDYENSLDYQSNAENNRSSGISENIECDSLDNSYSSDYNIKVSVSIDSECTNTENSTSNEIQSVQLRKLSPSPELKQNETSLQTLSSPTVEKIDLFKGIERTLSELLKKELMEDHGEEKIHNSRPVCSAEGSAGAPVVAPVCRPLSPEADARFTSRVMITHDRVSVVTSDTTRLMRDIIVHHTNSQNEPELTASEQDNENSERLSDAESPQPSGGVTVVSNADTLSAVVCLEEGLADDDSWVEDVSHDDDATSPSDSDSGDEATLPTRGDFAYCRRSLDFTLHTIVEESCEESETEQTIKKTRPISATELEKYFFFDLGDGSNVRDDDEQVSETSSICSEGGESIVETEQQTNRKSGDSDELVSSRLEKYFLSGFMGFNQERHHSDGSGSVGSDSEGKQSPEQRRKRLVRARGAPRSHSSSLDNLLAGDEPSQDTQEISDGSSTETEDRHESLERLDMPGEMKRKKQSKKSRGSPADERRQSVEFPEETRDDTRSVSEGEDGRLTPRVEFPPLGSELSESKKQTSRDSGFVGSCDDLLKNGDNSSDYVRSHESKTELEEIIEEARPELDERIDRPPSSRPPPSPLTRKDSFNNWSSDEETNLMMTKMRTFFKQMINTGNVRSSTPASSNSESSRPPKPPQLLYFESELTRLMKTVPGIRDEEVREIVEYLSSEDTWSDSYDSSDYAGSDLEGTSANRSALRKQISDSCREIIDEFDRGNSEAGSLERDAVGAYQRLAATLGRAGDGSPPLFGKVMRHIGGRLVALMHEVSAGAPPSTDEDSASEPGALARSRSHDILEATASRGSVASDCERFSWRGSFESALLAADSRGTLGGEARRSPAGAELASQKSHSRSCGAISGSEDRLWRGRRRASAPDAESEEEQRAGSLPRLPSITGASVPAGPVKSARYRAPGFRTATRAASAPGLHVPRRRRPAPQPALSPASTPSLQVSLRPAERTIGFLLTNMSDVKVIVKKKEPSCWNCFTIEDGDGSDTEDKNIPAITLPKVREEHREKLKVYSFFAAELSKPTAVSLTQKVSKHCAIGKKIDEKILEQLKDSESNGLGCNGNNTPDDSNKNITQIQDTKQLTITDNNSVFDVSNSKVLDIMPNLQEDQNAETKNPRSTLQNIINDIMSDNTTQKSKLRTEFFSSMPDTNNILKDDSDCEYKLNNTNKLTELESDLEPSVIKFEELLTKPQLQKEISTDPTDSNYRTEHTKNFNVLQKVHSEEPNTKTQNAEISTFKDVINDNILDITTQSTKITMTENFASLSDTNNIILHDSECEHKISNANKRLKRQNSILSDISTDTKSIDSTDSSLSDLNVLQEVNREDQNTEIINAERLTSIDVIYDTIPENVTLSTEITGPENFGSLSDTNKIIHESDCKDELSNTNKTTDLNLALIPTVLRSEELSQVTQPQLQKEITLIAPNKSSTLKTVDTQSETITEPENDVILKVQNSFSSDLTTDTKSIDSTDSSYRAENINDSTVLQEVHREDQNTEIINAARFMSKDVTYDTISETVTQSTKITKPENFGSILDTNKIIHDSECKDELSNTNKTTDLNLALIPTVLRSEELSQVTQPQLQKEITLIAPNKSPTLKRVDTQSETITKPENNVIQNLQNSISSDLTTDTKSIDPTDSSYRAENINDSTVLQEVHREDQNTEIINAERLTSKDVIYDTIPENVTPSTIITKTENFNSISNSNKVIHDSECKDEISNTNKTTDLNLALIPTVLRSDELSQVTPPQLQKEITLILPSTSTKLKRVDTQSETITEPENNVILKVQNSFSSDLTTGTKSIDSIDSNYPVDNINYSTVLQEVHREDQNTEIINAERLTSKDVIYDTILENVTPPSTIITKPENFDSVSNSNKVIHDSDNKDELSNTNKTTDLNLALIPTVLESEDLSQVTPPELQKEITLIAPNKSSTLKSVDTQSETITEPENDVILKVQNSFSSDLSTDTVTKSADSTASSNCAENKKDSNVLHDLHSENSKTKIITKLPILKQNINSRYSPLYKLKRSLSTDKATVTQDCVDNVNKSSSEINPTVYGGNYQEMTPKKENLTKRSSSSSNIETKPITPLRKKKIESKNIALLPNQSINKISTKGSQVSPINKEKVGLSKTLTVTSKTLPTVTPLTLKKIIPKESITSSKNPTSKTHTIIPTEKKSFLKRKSSELSLDTKCNSSDIGYCSESTEDMNLSQNVHRKHSKSDIGTKLPVLKQNVNSKYSPLHKLKKAFSKDKAVSKEDTGDNGKCLTEPSEVDHEKKSEETTLEVKDLSAINISKINIPLVTSTPKNKETDSRSSEEIYKSSETLAEPTVNHDKSEIAIPSTVYETEEKKINFDMPRNEKFSKSRSLSTEGLGKILCPSIIRRSTLSMDPRSLNFQDEMYISEESPGHATLPRRSNSPLPHERDLDRERFPHNRSGLQTRSESMASVYSGAGEGIRGGVPVRGEVQFSLVYNYRLGALEVGVKRCRDLAPIDVKKNRSDPYVKVYLLPDKSKTGKRKTKVKKNTLNPVFEETLSFQSSLESLSTRALWLSAWHADMFGRNDFLGEVTLPLAGRVFDDPAPNWYALVERSERPEEMSGARGDLIVGLKFELEPRASTGTLHVLVKEARRLVPSRPGAVADVFCKSYLLPERGRLHKQKTPVCRRTLAPSWRAPLQYPRLSAAALSERALELTLWDRDRLASNEFLGAVRLSRGTGTYRGESVSWMDSTGKEVSLWETMLQQPNFWVEGSLPLRPHLNN